MEREKKIYIPSALCIESNWTVQFTTAISCGRVLNRWIKRHYKFIIIKLLGGDAAATHTDVCMKDIQLHFRHQNVSQRPMNTGSNSRIMKQLYFFLSSFYCTFKWCRRQKKTVVVVFFFCCHNDKVEKLIYTTLFLHLFCINLFSPTFSILGDGARAVAAPCNNVN